MLKIKSSKGFTAAEGLLILIIVVLIAGVGYYVLKQRQTNSKDQSSSATKAESAPVGTVAGVDEVMQNDINDEQKIESELASQEQKAAASDNNAVQSAGDGYEVSY